MEFFFCNQTFNKKEIKKLIHWFLINYGTNKTSKLADELKKLGFMYATKAGISLGIEDLKIPPLKSELLKNTEKEIIKNERKFQIGKINSVEKFQKVIDIWTTTNDILTNESVLHFRQTNLLNPVYMMAFSGARGNISQVRQLVGMRGLMSDSQGEIIDLPIKSNFKEGLTVTEYLISCYGARKGLIDTALRTANSGYLTRRLVDVAQSMIIKQLDCGTFHGILIAPLIKDKKIYIPINQRLIGRVLSKNIKNEKTGKIIATRGQDICPYLSKKILKYKNIEEKIYVRSPLTCQLSRSICQLCYGWDLTRGKIIQIGETVGITAAQSIGEPGTQLTMRTFHTGGVFSGNVSEKFYSPYNGTIFDINIKNSDTRIVTKYGEKASLITKEATIFIKDNQQNISRLKIPPYSLIFVKNQQKVYYKQIIAEIYNPEKMLSKHKRKKILKATKDVKTKIAGEIYFNQLSTLNSPHTSGKIINPTIIKKKGRIWILNGKIITYFFLIQNLLEKLEKKKFTQQRNKKSNIYKQKQNLKKSLNSTDFYKYKVSIRTKKANLSFKNTVFSLNQRFKKEINDYFLSCEIQKFKKILVKQNILKSFKPKSRKREEMYEIKSLNDKKQCLLKTRKNTITFKINPEFSSFSIKNKKMGDFIINKRKPFKIGQIIQKNSDYFIIRKGKPILITKNTKMNLQNNDLISKNNLLFKLEYIKSKTGDIVQGLPKIEELLEIRKTKNLQPIFNNPDEKLKQYFHYYKKIYSNDFQIANRKSIERIQKFLVENIQAVYKSQGIEISDKHIEIIVKQMTSKVIIKKSGSTFLLIGEIIDLHKIEKINKNLINKAQYAPLLRGITKASLNTESFISASSFQETTKILVQSAIEGKIDWLYGLKENIILGRLIPAGTGI